MSNSASINAPREEWGDEQRAGFRSGVEFALEVTAKRATRILGTDRRGRDELDALLAILADISLESVLLARVQRPVVARDEPPHGDDTRGVLVELRDRLVLHAGRFDAASNLTAIGMRVAVDFVNEALLASDKESP